MAKHKSITNTIRKTCLICGVKYTIVKSRASNGMGKFCSQHCRNIYLIKNRIIGIKTGHRGGKREDLGIYVRSSWEANYARYLNFLIQKKQIQKWEYEADTFEFKGIKRGTRFYTPDFKVWENNGDIIYHEVKGYFQPKDQVVINRMVKYYPEVKTILIDKTVYKSIKQFSALIPNWEK